MNAGRLKHPITIISPQLEKNRFGEEKTVEKVKIRTRAEIRHDRGSRIVENDEVVHAYDITFIVWLYIKDVVEETDVIKYDRKLYRIEALEPVEETKILYIKASLINV